MGISFLSRKTSVRVSLGVALYTFGLFACLVLIAPRSASAALTAEQKAQVSADLAANKSYTEIIASAVTAGMSVEDVVAYLVQTKGAAPGAVYEIVYAAITAGYDAEKVITGALTGGADLQTVFNAAYTAGADRDKIFAGALGAGFNQSQIADAYANVSITGGAGDARDMSGGKASPSVPK